METSKVWNKEEIKEKLMTDIRWLERGIVAIYKKQTQDEKVKKETNKHNNVGFTGADANILSSFAEQILKGKKLSEKQMFIATKRMEKYAGQLAKIANKKI